MDADRLQTAALIGQDLGGRRSNRLERRRTGTFPPIVSKRGPAGRKLEKSKSMSFPIPSSAEIQSFSPSFLAVFMMSRVSSRSAFDLRKLLDVCCSTENPPRLLHQIYIISENRSLVGRHRNSYNRQRWSCARRSPAPIKTHRRHRFLLEIPSRSSRILSPKACRRDSLHESI